MAEQVKSESKVNGKIAGMIEELDKEQKKEKTPAKKEVKPETVKKIKPTTPPETKQSIPLKQTKRTLGPLFTKIILFFLMMLGAIYLLFRYKIIDETIAIYSLTGVCAGMVINLIALIKREYNRKKLFKPKEEIKKEKPEEKTKEEKITELKKEKGAIAKKMILAEKKPGFFTKLLGKGKSLQEKIFRSQAEKLEIEKARKLKAQKEKEASMEELRKKKLREKKEQEEEAHMEELRKKKLGELREKAKRKAKLRLIPKILITLLIFAITASFILDKKGIISFRSPIIAVTLILITGTLVIYIAMRVSESRKGRGIEEEKEEEEIHKIERDVIARASKYGTDIDKLYHLIDEVGSLTIPEVVEGFGISREQAEEWAKMLESNNLIDLTYPAMGEMRLCKKKSKKPKGL